MPTALRRHVLPPCWACLRGVDRAPSSRGVSVTDLARQTSSGIDPSGPESRPKPTAKAVTWEIRDRISPLRLLASGRNDPGRYANLGCIWQGTVVPFHRAGKSCGDARPTRSVPDPLCRASVPVRLTALLRLRNSGAPPHKDGRQRASRLPVDNGSNSRRTDQPATSRQARISSATLQACAGQPRGVCGGSPSNISETLPRQASSLR